MLGGIPFVHSKILIDGFADAQRKIYVCVFFRENYLETHSVFFLHDFCVVWLKSMIYTIASFNRCSGNFPIISCVHPTSWEEFRIRSANQLNTRTFKKVGWNWSDSTVSSLTRSDFTSGQSSRVRKTRWTRQTSPFGVRGYKSFCSGNTARWELCLQREIVEILCL